MTNMGRKRWAAFRWQDGATVAAGIVVVGLALPVLAALILAARVAVLAAVVATLVVGAVALAFSPRFRDWLQWAGEAMVPYKGMDLATDVALGPGHVWARVDGTQAEVGADDLMQAALGPVDRVELPEVGRRVRAGEPVFRLHRAERSVSGPSPLTGTVTAVNDALRTEPGRVNAVPFRAGWAVRLAADDPRGEARAALKKGAQARELFRTEVDRLLGAVAAADGVPALADGGALVARIHERIDDQTWARLGQTVFTDQPLPAGR